MRKSAFYLIPAVLVIAACGGVGNDSNQPTSIVIQGGAGIEQILDVYAVPGSSTNIFAGQRIHRSISPNQVKPEVQLPYQEGRVTFVVTELDKTTVLTSVALDVTKGMKVTVTANQERTGTGALRTTIQVRGETQ